MSECLAIEVYRRPGRPTLATPGLEKDILDGVANGRFLSEVLEADGMPCIQTVDRWARERPDFRSALTRARELGAEGLVREGMRILDAADDSEAPPVTKAVGQANYRKWLAGCHDRDTYGERPAVVAVQVNATVATAFGKMAGKVDGE